MNRTRRKGFTLIEMIATLVLTALVGTAFVMALVFGVDQYARSSGMAALTQKSRLALTRMYVELAEVQGLDTARQGGIGSSAFYYIDHNGDAGSLALSNGRVIMNGSYTLVDGVDSDEALFTYHDASGGTWTPGDGFDDLFEIAISLKLTTPDGSTGIFTHSVNPRRSTIPNAPKME